MAATNITTNTDVNVICPGEKLVLTCTDQGTTTQRWRVEKDGIELVRMSFVLGDQLGPLPPRNLYYNFTLLSTSYNHFESTLSVMVQNTLDNAVVECTGARLFSQSTVTIKIAGTLIV